MTLILDHFPPWKHLAGLILPAATITSCAYDGDNRCGQGQTYSDELTRCVCSSGFAHTPDGCIECGKNETPAGASCACKSGYVRPRPQAACEREPAAQPPSGDGGSALPDGDAGSTDGTCTENDDCEEGQACHIGNAACMSPPPGLGKTCASDVDCAGSGAEHCDIFFTQTCQEKNCSFDPDSCFVGTECCDLSAFGLAEPLCVPEGNCAP